MSDKSCSKCKEIKPLPQFNLINGKYLGYCARCQYVHYQRPAALRKLARLGKKPRTKMPTMNAEEKKALARVRASAWTKANPEKRSAAKKARRALLNPPKPKVEKPVKLPKVRLSEAERKARKAEYKRLFRQNNPEKKAAERKRSAERAKNCPHRRVARNLRKRLKEFLGTGTKIGSFSSMVGCTKEELVKHLEQQFAEGMSWGNYGEWEIDHIKPIAAFDFEAFESRKQVNHFTNLMPLWKAENGVKSSLFEGKRYSRGKVVTD